MPAKLNRLVAGMHKGLLRDALPRLIRLMDNVAAGRISPSLEDMSIGSGRKVTATVIFFDICGFTNLTSSDDPETLKRTLLLLNCVIPGMMRALYRYGAYVEKNTGDGLMAIHGIELRNDIAANQALDIAEEMFYVLDYVINPALNNIGIASVRARIGIDMGQVLISRIGVANGSSKHDRNSLTAVGPAANLACKIQGMAGENEIWVGDSIKSYASHERQYLFDCVTPNGWIWNYGGNPNTPYHCWRYNGVADDPMATILTGGNPLIRR